MGIKTKIEWCDSTINPIMGCTGCALRKNHCYAAVLCAHYAGRKGWPKSFDQPEFFPGRLEKAIRWPDLSGTERLGKPWLDGKPRIIFVNDMSDGFCPDVDAWGWLLCHIDAIEGSPHIWLLLTKWPDRMREFFVSVGGVPDNVWLGASIENQDCLWRVKELLKCQAAVRFVSAEPLLGPIDLTRWLNPPSQRFFGTDGHRVTSTDILRPGLDWVIVGGESGPGARPMHPNWVRGIRDQCIVAGAPFFFKQWGAWSPNAIADLWSGIDEPPNNVQLFDDSEDSNYVWIARVGKKRAGRLLDGKKWNEVPVISGG